LKIEIKNTDLRSGLLSLFFSFGRTTPATA